MKRQLPIATFAFATALHAADDDNAYFEAKVLPLLQKLLTALTLLLTSLALSAASAKPANVDGKSYDLVVFGGTPDAAKDQRDPQGRQDCTGKGGCGSHQAVSRRSEARVGAADAP